MHSIMYTSVSRDPLHAAADSRGTELGPMAGRGCFLTS